MHRLSSGSDLTKWRRILRDYPIPLPPLVLRSPEETKTPLPGVYNDSRDQSGGPADSQDFTPSTSTLRAPQRILQVRKTHQFLIHFLTSSTPTAHRLLSNKGLHFNIFSNRLLHTPTEPPAILHVVVGYKELHGCRHL